MRDQELNRFGANDKWGLLAHFRWTLIAAGTGEASPCQGAHCPISRPQQPLHRGVILGLAIAILLDTFVQVTWKESLSGASEQRGLAVIVLTALKTPLFYVAMAGFAAQMFNWTRVLAKADLSFAQPITALSYLSVLAISRAFLHETLSPRKIVAIFLILAGVACISRSGATAKAAHPNARKDA
jgi:drug/metabolite transporter (DMT)-like permease